MFKLLTRYLTFFFHIQVWILHPWHIWVRAFHVSGAQGSFLVWGCHRDSATLHKIFWDLSFWFYFISLRHLIQRSQMWLESQAKLKPFSSAPRTCESICRSCLWGTGPNRGLISSKLDLKNSTLKTPAYYQKNRTLLPVCDDNVNPGVEF